MSHRGGVARRAWIPSRSSSLGVPLFCLLALLLDASAATADQLGVFDLRRIFAESKQVKSIHGPFEAKLAAKQRELADKQQALRAAVSAPAGEPKGNSALFQEVTALQKELTQIRSDLEAAIKAAVQTAVAAVAKERGLTLILDKRFVFHAADSADVTALVLERLDGGKPTTR